jgi:hypothetical protein
MSRAENEGNRAAGLSSLQSSFADNQRERGMAKTCHSVRKRVTEAYL